ncbi:hypothetical protein L6164_032347 [Bauhinia variegata]|uniref:Uncharacterized protein n=1 Tax=Bauhinia variegata TaxID=167791 RepID=A0ACB9KNU0_BAUVA|nr:hypothetical protein L6164_032347 [Bauhinia variegata]
MKKNPKFREFLKLFRVCNSALAVPKHQTVDGVAVQTMEAVENDQTAVEKPENSDVAPPVSQKPLSKSAQKKLLKQQRFEAKKAEKKALMKEQKRKDAERKRKEWEENLASACEEERLKLIESRKSLRKERME